MADGGTESFAVAPERLFESLRLFNERRFFESHEVLESLWLERKDDPYRDFYKGVIQAAAALYQFERGRLAGFKSLLESAVGYLKKFGPRAMGLEVTEFIRDLERFREDGTYPVARISGAPPPASPQR